MLTQSDLSSGYEDELYLDSDLDEELDIESESEHIPLDCFPGLARMGSQAPVRQTPEQQENRPAAPPPPPTKKVSSGNRSYVGGLGGNGKKNGSNGRKSRTGMTKPMRDAVSATKKKDFKFGKSESDEGSERRSLRDIASHMHHSLPAGVGVLQGDSSGLGWDEDYDIYSLQHVDYFRSYEELTPVLESNFDQMFLAQLTALVEDVAKPRLYNPTERQKDLMRALFVMVGPTPQQLIAGCQEIQRECWGPGTWTMRIRRDALPSFVEIKHPHCKESNNPRSRQNHDNNRQLVI